MSIGVTTSFTTMASPRPQRSMVYTSLLKLRVRKSHDLNNEIGQLLLIEMAGN